MAGNNFLKTLKEFRTGSRGICLLPLSPEKTGNKEVHMEEPMHCLWSGGWDSSFRILQLIISEEKIVQPYYLYDRRRKSSSHEIQAIYNIAAALRKEFPSLTDRLRPLIVVNKSRLRKDKETKSWYQDLIREHKLGIQYEWFARFTRQYGIDNLAIGFVKHPENDIPPFNALLEKNLLGQGILCRLIEDPNPSSLELFRDFNFPIIHLTKEDMGEHAAKGRFHHILLKSWYCFNPGPDSMPCGKCKPCQIAKKSGYSHDFLPNSHRPLQHFRIPLYRKQQILDLFDQ